MTTERRREIDALFEAERAARERFFALTDKQQERRGAASEWNSALAALPDRDERDEYNSLILADERRVAAERAAARRPLLIRLGLIQE